MDVDDSYLAGIIDGEGTISLRDHGKKGIVAELILTNTNELVMDMFDSDISNVWRRKQKLRDSWKPINRVYITNLLGILSILERVKPYVRLKKRHVELMIEFCQSRISAHHKKYSTREWEIQKEVFKLNRRGL